MLLFVETFVGFTSPLFFFFFFLHLLNYNLLFKIEKYKFYIYTYF